MRHGVVALIGLFGLMAGTCLAGAADVPRNHPDISKIKPTSRPAGVALPSGHPDISKMRPTSGPTGEMVLPAGHPRIGSARRPTTGPAAAVGTLTVSVKQGTKDGPSLAGHTVSVNLYYEDQLIRSAEAELDKNGVVSFKDLPMALPVRPLVRFAQGGVVYQRMGDLMDGYSARQSLEMTSYEATERAPQWKVVQRQAMVGFDENGLRVTEMLRILNPTDRTWIGTAQQEGRRTTVWVNLPAGTEELQIEGPKEAFISGADGRITSVAPLMPGTSRMVFSYLVPGKEGKATVAFTAPADVAQMTVFVQEGAKVHVQGLRVLPPHDMGQGKALMYKAADMTAGDVAGVTIELPAKKAMAEKK